MIDEALINLLQQSSESHRKVVKPMKKKKTPAISESFAAENSAFQEIGER